MSLETEGQRIPDKVADTFDGGSQKLCKISYTREFLLSLSKLEICINLPKGFDRSVLGEFEDTSHDIQERPRITGGLPLQGFRRGGDYGSSPPTRGDSSNYSKGIYGRWDNRSSGRTDKDSDSQSDRDSESGRRYGNPSRRSWQSTDHDGLLGSGSFPRPSGHAGGSMASKVRGDDHYQLKKSNEPYHPPRPYKAVPHSRRETNDSLDDETFGSSEATSEDRAEEERKRRASFQLMRKEQQKVLQEKQKVQVGKHKDDFLSDDTALLEQTKEERTSVGRNNELDGSVLLPVSNNGAGNSSSLPLQTSAPRPLVPPGFASTILEKNSGPKSVGYNLEKEISRHELDGRNLHAEAKPVQNGILDNQVERQSVHEPVMNYEHPGDMSTHAAFATKGEMTVNPLLAGLEFTNRNLGLDEVLDNDGEIMQLNTKKLTRDDIVNVSLHQDNSTSILEKIFSSSTAVNTSSNFGEPCGSKPDVTWSPNPVQSSKFSHWFLEDEKNPTENFSSGRPSDLLSLIGGGEKGGIQASDVKVTKFIPPEITHQGFKVTNIPSATTGISEQVYNYGNNVEAVPAVPAVLTCEDLEQKILSEYSENSSTLPPPVQDTSVSVKAGVDNNASLHLLSLLKKDINPSRSLEIGSSENLLPEEIGKNIANTETLQNPGKNITLEALFGSAFMKELQSVEAPVSVNRSSVGSTRTDVFEPRGSSFTTDGIRSNWRNNENNVSMTNSEQPTKLEKVENWLGFKDPQIEVGSSKLKHGEIQLPEEESLITVGDPLNPRNLMYMPAGNSSKGDFLSNTSIDIAEKLAALNAGYKDERAMGVPEGPHFVRPYDPMESERQFHNLHARASPPQFNSPHMSHHGRPFLHPMECRPAHIMAPESMIQRDGRANNQFPVNMLCPPFHQPNNTGPTVFPSHHQMLQQMQRPGGFSPPNMLQEFPRGGPVPSHPRNQPTSFLQERNPMQGFPPGPRQPNINGLGMQLLASDVSGGRNNPEALQRLIGMELGANLKQVPPFGANSQVGYNQEPDMGFRYR